LGKLFNPAEIECNNQVTVDGRRRAFISRMNIRDATQTENLSVPEYREVQLAPVSRHELSVDALTRSDVMLPWFHLPARECPARCPTIRRLRVPDGRRTSPC
jgi:hypothetical protein